MKRIVLPREINFLIGGIFCCVLIALLIDVINSTRKMQEELNEFRKLNINSRMLELKDLNRGNHLLKIVVNNDTLEFSLPISYDVKKYRVLTGDSISKNANSGKFDIYRNANSEVYHLTSINFH